MKKLEEVLNMPESKEIIDKEKAPKKLKKNEQPFLRNIDEMDKISAALPQVTGLGEASDEEFDDLATRATNAYDDLVELGMNVEAKYSARIFEVASSMLKNAIDAKSAKIDKKLKMIELQLKKQKQDQGSEEKTMVAGAGVIVSDRNSLLEKLKNMD